jgi:hypothetical protein
MSMETHVFFRGKLPSKVALARAMKELGFPFSITPASGSLEQQSGFMPMRLRGEETGVEFDVFGDHLAVEEFAENGVDQSFERRASFRWGGSFEEAVAGMCSAAALAKLVNGVVFDEAENRLLSADEAIALARKSVQELPAPEKPRRPQAKTAVKRILVPLLEKRKDLAWAGNNLLLIRPVRHLMRGADFHWHDHGTSFTVSPYLRPLYQPSELFLEPAVWGGRPEDPDLVPILLDRMAEEIFEPLGGIATIDVFLEMRWPKPKRGLMTTDLFPSILLSRGLKEARALAEKLERWSGEHLAESKVRLEIADRKDRTMMYFRRFELKEAEDDLEHMKRLKSFVAQPAADVLAHYHDWEANVARGYKIEHIWEPSPFPIEAPGTRRTRRSSDPHFSPKPWLDWWYRQERLVLLRPLSREEAEHRHSRFQSYTLMTRLPEDRVLVLSVQGTLEKGHWSPPVKYRLGIYDPQRRRLAADFEQDADKAGLLRMKAWIWSRMAGPVICI